MSNVHWYNDEGLQVGWGRKRYCCAYTDLGDLRDFCVINAGPVGTELSPGCCPGCPSDQVTKNSVVRSDPGVP